MDERISLLERELHASPTDEGLQEEYFHAMRRSGQVRILGEQEIFVEQYEALQNMVEDPRFTAKNFIEIGSRYGNVQHLQLCSARITDRALGYLPQTLKSLDVRYTTITDQAIQELQKERPNLRINKWTKE